MNIHFGSKADPFAKKRFSIASFETVKIDYAKLPPGRLFGRPINLTCVESSFCDLCYEIENEKIVRTFLARKLTKKTRKYITSGGIEYVSDGVVGKHSPFAMRMIEAFKTRGDDGILTISEIIPFLEKIKQHEPRSGSFGDDEKGSDFVFVAKQ